MFWPSSTPQSLGLNVMIIIVEKILISDFYSIQDFTILQAVRILLIRWQTLILKCVLVLMNVRPTSLIWVTILTNIQGSASQSGWSRCTHHCTNVYHCPVQDYVDVRSLFTSISDIGHQCCQADNIGVKNSVRCKIFQIECEQMHMSFFM